MAFGLKTMLLRVVQMSDPWLAEDDIRPGERWRTRIEDRLGNALVGVVCVTPRGASSEWLHFEAGALSKLKGTPVIPLYCGFSPNDLPGTLASFQAVDALSQEGMLGVVQQIASRIRGKDGPSLEVVADVFSKLFPQFQAEVLAAQAAEAARGPTPTSAEERLRAQLTLIEESLAALHASHEVLARRLLVPGDRLARRARSAEPLLEGDE